MRPCPNLCPNLTVKNRQNLDENRQKVDDFRRYEWQKIPENKEKPRFPGVFSLELVMGVGPMERGKKMTV